MGLDLTLHQPAENGRLGISYGGFMRFRERLCEDVGWGSIHEYVGFGGEKQWPTDKPLVNLLHHSDCEGELWGWECEGLADAIRAVIRLWPENDHYREYGERLASLIEAASDAGSVIEFH